jgi:hypothetical protein
MDQVNWSTVKLKVCGNRFGFCIILILLVAAGKIEKWIIKEPEQKSDEIPKTKLKNWPKNIKSHRHYNDLTDVIVPFPGEITVLTL